MVTSPMQVTGSPTPGDHANAGEQFTHTRDLCSQQSPSLTPVYYTHLTLPTKD